MAAFGMELGPKAYLDKLEELLAHRSSEERSDLLALGHPAPIGFATTGRQGVPERGRYTSTVQDIASMRVGNRSNQPRCPSSTAKGRRHPRRATSGSFHDTAAPDPSG